MSRRTAIILVISATILIIAGFLAFYFFFMRDADSPSDKGAFPGSGDVAFEDEPPTVIEDTISDEKWKPILRQLSFTPVAGAAIGGRGENTVVRYVDTATGNIFEVPATAGEPKRLTNTTIPKIYDALWNKSGNAVILRYLKEDGETVETFSARLRSGTSGTEGELQGTFLPADISDLAVSPNSEEIFYIRERNGGAVGTRALFSGSGRAEVWRSPVREWLVSWPSANVLLLTTKASALSEGLAAEVSRSGTERTVLRGIRGLTALSSPSGKHLLYSVSTDSGFRLMLQSGETKISRTLLLATFPEKCVWAGNERKLFCGIPTAVKGGSYPDSWYQGVVSFTDDVWSLGAEDEGNSLILETSLEADRALDIIKPHLSPDERFLVFINKNDGTLWSLQLSE